MLFGVHLSCNFFCFLPCLLCSFAVLVLLQHQFLKFGVQIDIVSHYYDFIIARDDECKFDYGIEQEYKTFYEIIR